MMRSKPYQRLLLPAGQLRRQEGMSLMEIIIVVALLGTLMTYLISTLSNTSEQAKVDQAKIAMGNIGQALRMFQVHNGKFPANIDDLLRDPGSSGKKWRGPYIEENKLVDPWDARFEYKVSGREYELRSPGIDGEMGNDDDVVYPEKAGGTSETP